ncbi:MAG: restriction endonuclease subunit S [Planctomycetes bacterium]|nr:restriction endonuclease subunit S [Planctomycetota bacterium]
MSEDENRGELPEGWTSTALKNCVDVLDKLRIPVNSDERQTRQGPIPYYGATGQVGWIDSHIFDEEIVLLGEDGAPFLDKSKPIAYIITGKSWVNNHAHVLRAVPTLTSSLFVKYFLDSFDFAGHVNGTTRVKLTQGSMNAIPLILPPLAEQKRIVAKVETLLARVNAARQWLAKVPALLKRFRQSVLAAACSGRLTANWRLHSPDSEPQTATGLDGEFDLPEKWKWVRFNELMTSLRSGSNIPPQNEATVFPVLRSSSVRPGFVDLQDVRYLRSDESENENNYLHEGDLLFTRLSGSLVGTGGPHREATGDGNAACRDTDAGHPRPSLPRRTGPHRSRAGPPRRPRLRNGVGVAGTHPRQSRGRRSCQESPPNAQICGVVASKRLLLHHSPFNARGRRWTPFVSSSRRRR